MPPESFFHRGMVLDGSGAGRPVDAGGAKRWSPEQGVLVVELDRHNPQTEVWLSRTAGLDPRVVEVGLAHEPRARLTAAGGGLLVSMRGVNFSQVGDPEDMVALRGWFDAGRVVLLRGRPVLAVDDLAALLQRRAGPTSAGGVLVGLIDALTERIADTLDGMDQEADELEDSAEADEPAPDLRRRISALRSRSSVMRRHIVPQCDMVGRLAGEETALFTEADRHSLRENHEQLVRVVEDLNLLGERLVIAQEMLAARVNERLSRNTYVLSIVAAVFLPLGLVAGVLGVNLGGIPGRDDPRAFVVLCVALVVLVAVELALLRKMRWM